MFKDDNEDQVAQDGERFHFNEESGEIIIYQPLRVQIQEVVPLIIKPKRAKKYLKKIDFQISWKAV